MTSVAERAATRLAVRDFDGAPAAWDAFVREQRGATHFHLYGWRQVMERSFGHECRYLEARRPDGELAGVLPLVRVRSLLFGHFLVSMPFVDHGGPLGDEDAVHALVEHARALAARTGAALLELRSAMPLPIGLPASHRKVTVVKPLVPGDPDAVWKALASAVRSGVRKAEKHGVQVRFGADQVRPFHEVFAYNMRDLGTPTHKLAYFEAIARAFPDSATFGCAYLDDRPLACSCGVTLGDEVHILYASQLRPFRTLQANMLLTWKSMERAAVQGIARCNFGRSTPGTGPHEFKRRWGAVDEPTYWYQESRGTVTKTPSPDDAAYAWGPRLWRRLPVPVASALGPHIVKYIP